MKFSTMNQQAPPPLTRWAVLHGSVVDEVPQLVHVTAVSAVHHMHHVTDIGVGEAVGAAAVELLQPGLQVSYVIFIG